MKLLQNTFLIGLVALCLFSACTEPKAEETPAPLPNIILINVDDIGYGDFGAYGQKLIKTPRIDQMAKEGARFTNFYAGSTVCGPSRAALLSGFHMGHHYSCTNGQGNLAKSFRTWPHLLKERGYRTAMFGKQHNAQLEDSTVLGDSPLDRGFEEFIGHLNAVDAHQYFFDGKTDGWKRRKYLWKSNAAGEIKPYHIGPDRYTQNEFMDHAQRYIREHQEEPFFLYLPFTIAHAELAIPKPGDPDHDAEKDKGIWEQYLDEEGNSIFPEFDYQGDKIYARPIPYKSRATFAAMISHLDRDVGEILDLLKELNLDENTLVLLTSDNGPADEGGVDEKQIDGKLESPFNSNGGLTGFKRSLYEGGIRVPMIAWWPGKIEAGKTIESPFANYDIGPSLLDLSESGAIPDADGLSFFPALMGEEQEEHEFLYWEWNEKQALRMGNWKFYRGLNESENDPLELYDLSSDPSEQRDLASDEKHADLLKMAKEILNRESAGTACKFTPLAL